MHYNLIIIAINYKQCTEFEIICKQCYLNIFAFKDAYSIHEKKFHFSDLKIHKILRFFEIASAEINALILKTTAIKIKK